MKHSVSALSPSRFIWLGVLFSIGFWFVDSFIDAMFFSHESYWAALQPTGVELYMRLLLCLGIIAFGYLASRFVESNNHLNRYIALSLKEDSNRYKAIYESGLFPLVVINRDLMIIEWNAEAEKIFGWNPHEAMGQNFYTLLFPEDAFLMPPTIEKLTRRGYLAAPNFAKDGNPVNFSWTHMGVCDWDGRMTSVLLIGQRNPDIRPA